MTREQAWALLTQYNKEPFHLRHAITVEHVMGWFAQKLGYGEEKEFWSQVGLLHDLDFEMWPEEHCVKSQELMREAGVDEAIIRATACHGWGHCVDIKPEHEMEKVLFACDELTGLIGAAALGFDMKDAASIGIIGAADGPTSILVSQVLHSNYVGAIAVAAYSYMALVPIIQPFAIKLVTTKKDRAMRMPYRAQGVSKRLRILFPIIVSVIAGLVAPSSVALVGFLMFGNLIRECGVLTTLSKTAQNELANLITLLLGITISFSMKADQFVKPETLLIMVLGLVAFVLDSVVGVLFVKVLNLFTPKNKINPMVGAAGISAFPMSSRVIEKLGQEADPQNHLLMHAVAANVSGQIASVVAGGVILQYCATHMIG